MSKLDIAQIVYELITVSGHEIASAVGARVWENEAPHEVSNAWDGTTAAIIFDIDLNDIHRGARSHRHVALTARCYGGSANLADAKAVGLKLEDRLCKVGNETLTSGVVLRVGQISGFPGDRESVTDWPVYQVQADMEITAR